jgi:IPT/TIG domain
VQTRSTTWTVQYGIGDAPTSFTSLTTFVDPGILGSTTINIPDIAALNNLNAPVWIRVAALSATTGSGSRDTFAIDDFSLTYDVSSAVTISSFVASSGPVGTQVTINGANFTSGMPVKFNGVASQLVSFVSASQIVATVPQGATTGYITVGDGAGAVASATAFVVGDFAVTTPLDGMDFGSVSVGSTGVDKQLVIQGGGLPGGTLNIACDSLDFLLSEDGASWSSSLSIAYDGSFAAPSIRFAPLTTGAKTAVVTLSSGGITVAKYTFTGTANSLQNVTGFAAVSGNAQIALSWTNASPSTKVIILAQQGSAVTNSPVASGSYTASTVYGSGTQVGTSYVVFNSTGTNVTVTGLTNRLLYYFKAFNVAGDNVSSGTSVSGVPYIALSNVITQWNFNGSTTTPSLGTGTAQAIGGTVIKTYTAGSPTDPLGAGGVGNFAWTLDTWTGGATETAGVQVNVSTEGKGSIVVSWDAYPSSTGPKYYRLLYTSDGSVATPVWTPYTATGSGTESGLYVNPVGASWTIQNQADLSGVPALQNNPNAAFRLVSAYAPNTSAYAAAQSGSTAGSGGTLRLDMLTVSGVVGVFNNPPTNMTLSATAIAENNALNAVVGTLSTTDSDVGDTFTYSLVPGTGSTDNASFNINGNSLQASVAFNFEALSSYSIRVRTTDSGGGTFEKVFTITVTNMAEGSTFEEAYPDRKLTDIAPNGLTYLANYAFGGSEGITPTLPIMDSSDPTKLKLVVVVRTHDVSIVVVGQTTTDLAGGWSTSGVSVFSTADASVPGNTARMVFSVDRSGSKRFLRATITK